MLPNTIQTDNEAPESVNSSKSYDRILKDTARDHLRQLIMGLTDAECDLLWEKWRTRHV
jgi:hypothetical protein